MDVADGELPLHPIGASLLLALSCWLAVLGAVLASGAFPAAARPAALRGPAAMTATCALVASTIALAALSLLATAGQIPWSWMLIAAGLGAVLAPPSFVLLPAAMVDRPLGSAILAACCGAASWLWLLGLSDAGPASARLDAPAVMHEVVAN